MIKLFKDGENMGISTNAQNESDFMDQFAELLSGLIEEGKYKNDWQFQLNYWLPQMVELCCKYRGYKSNVHEYRIMSVGGFLPEAVEVAGIDDHNKIHFSA